MRLELPLPPSANRNWRTAGGRTYVSKEAAAYKEKVRWLARVQGVRGPPLTGPVVLSLAIYRPRRRGDASNRIKVLEDALQGIAYEDDEQVAELHVVRFEDPANPRVVVRVEAQRGGGA